MLLGDLTVFKMSKLKCVEKKSTFEQRSEGGGERKISCKGKNSRSKGLKAGVFRRGTDFKRLLGDKRLWEFV